MMTQNQRVNPFDLTGKTALVTGAASGIGLATAQFLSDAGAKVFATDLREDPDSAVPCHRLNVACEADWRECVARCERDFGLIDILVNNAGISGPGNDEGPIEQMDHEMFMHFVAINQAGTFLGMKHVIPSMKRAGGGSIINMSSAAGIVGVASSFAYTATKFAVTGMTKAAALELGEFRIRVNSVHPGPIETPIHYRDLSAQSAAETAAFLAKAASAMPLRRFGTAQEVAALVGYLASDAAAYSTGSAFIVDGGMCAG